ncbi:MAG: outer membrane lipoprotein carrier protein LolA [Rhodospirillales bacterium]|nr:outer membrane lipoprotein carrier protein LolA [Rhodospirillales bacterium]
MTLRSTHFSLPAVSLWHRVRRVLLRLPFLAVPILFAAGSLSGLPDGPSPAVAALSPTLELDPDDQVALSKIEDKLNAIRTVDSAFVQESSNGETAQGRVYLSRPGKMRIEYQPPVPVLVVANGNFLIYYDKKLEQVSYIPLDSTPAGILLDKHISLSSDALVVTHLDHSGDALGVTVVRKDHPGEGSITLIFDESSLALRRWAVTDAQGVTTVVSLVNPSFNEKLSSDLFHFVDPRNSSRQSP